MAAQRFPEDFDAIVAGAPANNFGPLMALGVLAGNNVGGPNGIAVEKLALLKEAAIKACDATDGVTDRVISDPARCGFDPVQLQCKGETSNQCLTATEVAAAKRVYAGVRNAKGELVFPGTGFGSEPLWAAYASPGFRIGESFFQNVVANDSSWRSASFEVDRDLARAEAAGVGDITATDPDLSAFLSRGGKLLLYHGTTDGLIPWGNTENYYNSVVEKLGAERAAQHVRFFRCPAWIIVRAARAHSPSTGSVRWSAGMRPARRRTPCRPRIRWAKAVLAAVMRLPEGGALQWQW